MEGAKSVVAVHACELARRGEAMITASPLDSLNGKRTGKAQIARDPE